MKNIMLMFLLMSFVACKGGGGAGSTVADTATTTTTNNNNNQNQNNNNNNAALVEGVDTHHSTSEAIFATYATQYSASVVAINTGLGTNYARWNATDYPFVYKDTGFGIVSGSYIECKTYPDGTHEILVGNGWETYDDTNTLSGYGGLSTRKAMLANFTYTAVIKCVNGISDAGINTVGGASSLVNTYRNPTNNIIYFSSSLAPDAGVLMCLNQVGSYAGNRLSNLFVNYPTSGYTKAFIASVLTGSTQAIQMAEAEISQYNYDITHFSGAAYDPNDPNNSPDGHDSYSLNTTLRADHWVYLQSYINR
jgi:hypothetical protein